MDQTMRDELLKQEKLFRDSYALFQGARPEEILSESGERYRAKDLLASPNHTPLMRRVIETVVREAVEPNLVISQLFTKVPFDHGISIIEMPVFGALYAEDIAEGQEYPERDFNAGGATVTAKIGKSGLAVRFTEEMLKYSQFDMMGLFMRKAGEALARLKENKCATAMTALGVRVFDNLTPTSSLKGPCTGRNLRGQPNGSMTIDDLMDAWVQLIMQGFNPDTLVMHPLMFGMFLKDPYLKTFAIMAGGGTWFGGWTGSFANRNPFGGHGGGTSGPGAGQYVVPGGSQAGTVTEEKDYNQKLDSAPKLPDRWPYPVRIVVSPLVTFDPHRLLSDVILCDSTAVGVIFQEQEPQTDEFEDPARDLRKVKVMERYALGLLEEGQGIVTIKNVHLVANEVVLPAQTNLDVSATLLGPIDATVSPL